MTSRPVGPAEATHDANLVPHLRILAGPAADHQCGPGVQTSGRPALGPIGIPSASGMWQRQPIRFDFALVGSNDVLDQTMALQYRGNLTAVPTIRYEAPT